MSIDHKVKVCFIIASEEYEHDFKDLYPKSDIVCFIRKPVETHNLVKNSKIKDRLQLRGRCVDSACSLIISSEHAMEFVCVIIIFYLFNLPK